MKDGVRDIIGKTVSEVIVAQSARQPTAQVFLVFSDETYYEFWGEQISGAGGVDAGGADAAISYAKSFGSEITEHFPEGAEDS